MDMHRGGRAWVIGASSGIGAALAEELAERGWVVAISARDAAGLQALASPRLRPVPLDVTDAAACRAAAAIVATRLGGIDLLVVSSGYWQQMEADSCDPAAIRRHLEVNVLGMANVIDAALPILREQDEATIVGVSSVAAYRGFAGAQGYGASKAAQRNLLESLRVGLQGSGIDVVTVSPGFVQTPMTDGNAFRMPFIVSAQQAARSIVHGLAQGRAEIVFPLRMACAMRLARWIPQRMWARRMAPRRATALADAGEGRGRMPA